MKAFLILEDGHVFSGTSIGSRKEVISEIVFNTSMTGYLEVLTDPSYAGQAVCMTYPLIGELWHLLRRQRIAASLAGWIYRERNYQECRATSGAKARFKFPEKFDIPGIAGIDTRA